ncbi:MAG: lactate utilization protein [Clostridia bacterium]|nr:lactate utilization protein [Clostridia bacterium]
MDKRIEKTIKNLEKNNIKSYYAETKEEVIPIIDSILTDGDAVSTGGSVTLKQTGVLEYLKSGKYNFLDRNARGLSTEEIVDIFKKSFSVDAYFCSSNAVTEDGELYNVDGNANRVSAIAFGPEKVVMIVGVNKIVKDMDEAVKRVKTVAAPLNCKRLNRHTYCFEKGICADMNGGIGKGCNSDERICRHYLVSSKQAKMGRINVIIVNENLGY